MGSRIFVDGDVLLDLLADRDGFNDDATRLFSLIEEERIEGCTSSLVIANVYYITGRLENRRSALEKAQLLRTLLRILSVDERTIDMALASPYRDFEDSVQYHCALLNDVEAIVTRNTKDYPKGAITIIEPADYVLLYNRKTRE